jgi:hypothetical protein
MQLTYILTVALLALGVSASPSGTTKDPKPCYGGQVYNDGQKKCECPPKQSWGDKNKCCYEPMQPPKCPSLQKPWCSKSKTEYCEYVKSPPPVMFHRTNKLTPSRQRQRLLPRQRPKLHLVLRQKRQRQMHERPLPTNSTIVPR